MLMQLKTVTACWLKQGAGFNHAYFKTKWPSCKGIDSVSFWKIYKLGGSSD